MKKLICIALVLLVMLAMTTVCFATDAAEGADSTITIGAISETETSVGEDLGGAFSPARLAYAGRMTVVGLGMVFAVLALLWLVLTVFFRQKKEKPTAPKPVVTAPKQAAPAPVVTPAPATPATDAVDGATVAAITAAISAMIESDPALKSQFANGFRVVSFRRVGSRASAKGAWNR